jgi:hypothetical protein
MVRVAGICKLRVLGFFKQFITGSDILIMMRYFNELVGGEETANNTCDPEDQGRNSLYLYTEL